MIKPPQVDHNNWMLLKDPKSKEAQQIPLLSKFQIKKIQRRYTACHGKTTLKDKEQMLRTEVVRPTEEMRPNPRFNREKAEEDKNPKFLKRLKLRRKMKMH